MLRRLLWTVMALALALPWLTGCQTEPITGRKQLILLPPGQEIQLGVQAYEETLKTSTISNDGADNAILQRVGQRIAAAADRPDYQWEFKLLESKEVNAFCLPGGKVAVYTGILPVCQNEAGLAAVVGHEVGHALARHGNERMSQGMVAQLGAEILTAGTGKMSAGAQQAILAAYGVGSQYGALLPFSRTQERSADEIGLDLMARAGYEPAEAVGLWERMAAQESGAPFEILSTHPATKNRISDLRALQPAAQQTYQSSPNRYGLGETLHVPGAAK